jgi:iron complex outermembrane recepter protein
MRRGFGGLSLLAATSVLAIGTSAYAQEGAGAEVEAADENPNEIVVTAQRREERLQDVPISISAVSSEELSKRSVTDLSGLAGAVPGLSITHFTGFNASNLVAIRGISGQPLPIGAGQVTAIYLDGVYLSRPDAAFFSLDDVERLEVLRGPQGTLYGRNATAGAINIITREPGDEIKAGLDFSFGNFDSVSAKGSITGPIVGGLSAGFSASYANHDGYVTNVTTGHDMNARESYTLRGKLRYAADDERFVANLSADYSAVDANPAFKNLYASVAPGSAFLGLGNPKEVTNDLGSELLNQQTVRSKGIGLTLKYDASDAVELFSITSKRKVTALTVYDLDGTAAPGIVSFGRNSSETFNQELRASISGERVRATLGGNYFREEASFDFASGIPTAVLTNPQVKDATVLNAYALFGQFEFDLTDRLTVVGGLRFNSERRTFSLDYRAFPPVGVVTGQLVSGRVEDDAFIPSAGLNFKASEDVLFYAKVSQGYQAPGFNVAPGFPGSVDTFDAEKVWSYEAGIKSQFWDRRVTFNAAGFYYDYQDIQVRSTTGLGITSIDNAANAKIKGVEATFSVVPVSGLTLSAQATYIDAKYDSFCAPVSAGTPALADPPFTDAACTIPLVAPVAGLTYAQRAGNALNQAPEWAGGLTLDYRTPIGDAGEFNINVGYSWESNVFYTVANEVPLSSGGWERLDARVGFKISSGPEIYVYGRNLTDDRYVGYALRASPTLAPVIANEPRTYGIGIRHRF